MTSSDSENGLIIGLPLSGPNRAASRRHMRYRALAPREERNLARHELEDVQEPIVHDDEGHLITIAPTGSGKGRSVIIPNLLRYNGPVIVVDPKGENYAVTADYRQSIGQKVVCLDPFRLCDKLMEGGNLPGISASFNPFSIMRFTTADDADDVRTIVEMVAAESFRSDPFWPIMGKSLLSAAAQYLACTPNQEVSIPNIREFVDRRDIFSKISGIIEDELVPRNVRNEFSGLMNIAEAPTTFAGIVATAKSFITIFSDESVSRVVSETKFDLSDVFNARPITIYIVIPVDKLKSHQSLLRVWIGALIRLMTSRQRKMSPRTLLLIDEAAQLGQLPALEEAITLARGFGVQLWSFWQDVSQIKRTFPETWETVLNNCAIVQFFGAKNTLARDQISSITGIDGPTLATVSHGQQVVLVDGNRVCRANIVDYLNDTNLSSRAKDNPYYRI